MARGSSQKNYRATCARISLEIPREAKEQWDAYAAANGIPTGKMIRLAGERDMAAAGGQPPQEKPAAEAVSKPAPARKPKTSWGGITCMEED